jgi:dihydrolipoamide dehydrogenase
MTKKFDLVVLGSGPGGYVAALKAAMLGLSVCLIEKEKLGGVCLNWGCIPTKTLLKTAHLYESLRRIDKFAINLDENAFKLDFPALQQRKEQVILKLIKGIEFLLKKRNVEIIYGHGKFIDKNNIDVDGNRVGFDKAIIATGSYPNQLPNIKFDEKKGIVSNRGVLGFSSVPRSLLVIGGGVIGCEFADAYNCMGSKVTIVELDDHILPGEDEDIAGLLSNEFKKRKIDVFTSTKVSAVEYNQSSDSLKVKLDNGEYLDADKILLSVGRSPNISDCGLEKIGVRIEKNKIEVDEKMKTSVDSIYAIGDVTGLYLLAHVAQHQAIVAAENAAGKQSNMDYDCVVRCVYTKPEIASVGLTQKQAIDRGLKVKIGKFSLSASGKALIEGQNSGIIKIIAQAENDRIIGASICGIMATELVHEISVAIKAKLKTKELGNIIHAHPTVSESIMEAALDTDNQAIHIFRTS